MRGYGRNAQQQAGFTLIEVVVSSAILLIVFLAVLGTISVGRRSASMSENHRSAVHIARATMENLRRYGYYDDELEVGTKTLPGNRGTYVVTALADGWTKDITVNINWVEPNGQNRTLSLTTSMSRSLHR